jgi:hypothetical protein
MKQKINLSMFPATSIYGVLYRKGVIAYRHNDIVYLERKGRKTIKPDGSIFNVYNVIKKNLGIKVLTVKQRKEMGWL